MVQGSYYSPQLSTAPEPWVFRAGWYKRMQSINVFILKNLLPNERGTDQRKSYEQFVGRKIWGFQAENFRSPVIPFESWQHYTKTHRILCNQSSWRYLCSKGSKLRRTSVLPFHHSIIHIQTPLAVIHQARVPAPSFGATFPSLLAKKIGKISKCARYHGFYIFLLSYSMWIIQLSSSATSCQLPHQNLHFLSSSVLFCLVFFKGAIIDGILQAKHVKAPHDDAVLSQNMSVVHASPSYSFREASAIRWPAKNTRGSWMDHFAQANAITEASGSRLVQNLIFAALFSQSTVGTWLLMFGRRNHPVVEARKVWMTDYQCLMVFLKA